jgi:hypothetical protein
MTETGQGADLRVELRKDPNGIPSEQIRVNFQCPVPFAGVVPHHLRPFFAVEKTADGVGRQIEALSRDWSVPARAEKTADGVGRQIESLSRDWSVPARASYRSIVGPQRTGLLGVPKKCCQDAVFVRKRGRWFVPTHGGKV